MKNSFAYIPSLIMEFHHPFTSMLVGCTGSGKTWLLKKFLQNKNRLVRPLIDYVLFCYGELNESVLSFQSDQNIEIYKGMPSLAYIKELSQGKNLLVVLDDLMFDVKSTVLGDLFSRVSHNCNVSVIYVTQSLFSNVNSSKIARNNTHIFILMSNPAGELQSRNLGMQLYPRQLNFFLDSFHDATSKLFSYLCIDISPQTPFEKRLKTNIFPDEYLITYVPKA